MLMTIFFLSSSLFITLKQKFSWELNIMVITNTSFIIIMTNPAMNITFTMSNNLSMDSMSMLMISMTMWVTSLTMMASYYLKHLKKNHNLFIYASMMLMMTLMLCFSVNNMLLFYSLFELSLVPVLFLIMLWGQQLERKTASIYIMMYTITASLPLLIIILKLMKMNHSVKLMLNLYYLILPPELNINMTWFMLMMAFLVKLPMFSVHMWLPKAHVEAPVAGSMMLAAILLKLGGYGFIRMNKLINQQVPLIPYLFMSMAMMGAVITNIMCLRQTDLKALIAYSSISHMGLLMIGSLSNSKLGMYGSLVIMLTHGLSSSSMFYLTDLLYKMTNTRNIILMKMTPNLYPTSSFMWTLVLSSNMALPPSLNILSEIIIMFSLFMIMKSMIIMLMITSFTTACYSMYLYSMINHGNNLNMANPAYQMKSISLISTLSHLWPLLMLSSIPMKLTNWC